VNENDLSKIIIGAAIEAHRSLGGPGLLESVYEEALAWELLQKELDVKRQVLVPIRYKGELLSSPLRLDMLVNDLVVVESKATANYNPIFESQALTYLRLLNLKLALVINFGERYVKNGIRRVVNGL
jgi:GxxExxY protein